MLRLQAHILSTLITITALVAATSVLLGRAQPSILWAEFLHLDVCELPCWIGIVPDQSTLQDARAQIERVYRHEGDYTVEVIAADKFTVISRRTGYTLSIVLDDELRGLTPNRTVRRISLIPYIRHPRGERLLLPLESLSPLLTEPESTRIASGVDNPRQVLFYRQRVEIYVDNLTCDKVQPDQPVHSIALFGQLSTHGMAWLSDVEAWRGFGQCHNIPRQLLTE